MEISSKSGSQKAPELPLDLTVHMYIVIHSIVPRISAKRVKWVAHPPFVSNFYDVVIGMHLYGCLHIFGAISAKLNVGNG